MSAVDKIAAASSRLESVCSAFLHAQMGLDESDMRTLVPLLMKLEDDHCKIVEWIARKRGLDRIPSILTTTDVRAILKGQPPR